MLPIALMLVVLLTVLTPALLFLSSNGFFHSKKNSQSQQARFLADAAYQAALQIIYRAAKTADTSPPFPLNATNELDLINQIRQIRSSADTTDNGSYQVTDLPGTSNPEIRNGQRIYYLQAQGMAGPVVSTIQFKLLFAQNVSQIIVPPGGFPNPPGNVKDLIVYDPNTRQYAQNQLSTGLGSAAYTPNVTCMSCTTPQAVDNIIQSNLKYDPLVIRVGTISLRNNTTWQCKRSDGKRLVIMADQVVLADNVSLTMQGTLISEKTVSFGNNSNVRVEGDLIIKNGDFVIENNSMCTVSGQLAVSSDIRQDNQSELTVSGWLAASQIQTRNNGTLNALGGAAIVNTLVVRNNAGCIFNNQLIVGETITLQNNASLKPGSGSGSDGANVSFVGVQKL